MELQNIDFYLGFSLAAVILGLGAAVIILLLGVASLRSHYWFNILNGVDRFTIKFMLWPGATLLLIALIFASKVETLYFPVWIKAVLLTVLLINGTYLTFIFAPVIRKLENDDKSTFLKLPMPHQVLIFIAGSIAALSWTSHAIILWLEIVNLT